MNSLNIKKLTRGIVLFSLVLILGLAKNSLISKADKSNVFFIGNDMYEYATDCSGSGWAWDYSTKTLTLTNYSGSEIVFDAPRYSNTTLNIALKGTNSFSTSSSTEAAINVSGPSVSIKGTSGSKLVIGNKNYTYGVYCSNKLSMINTGVAISLNDSTCVNAVYADGGITFNGLEGSIVGGEAVKAGSAIYITGTTINKYIASYKNGSIYFLSDENVGTVSKYSDIATYASHSVTFTLTKEKKMEIAGLGVNKYFINNGIKYYIKSTTEVTAVGVPSKSITSIEIPDTITYSSDLTFKVTGIDNKAFKNCTKLKTVTIGKNVTYIGKNAFQNCTKLKKVTIGKNVTSIGANSFKGCKKLKNVVISTTKLKTVGKNSFTTIQDNATITVPKSKYTKYKKMLTKVCKKKVNIKKAK